MIDAEKAIINPVICKCGSEHRTPVKKIILEKGAFGRASEIVKDILPLGQIALVGCGEIGCYPDIRHNLRCGGYKVSEILIEEGENAFMAIKKFDSIRENVRLIVGVGSGTVSEIVKHLSYLKKIPNIFFMTAPSTDSFLLKSVQLDGEGGLNDLEGTPPQILVADTELKIPRALIASGYATLYLRLIGIFDLEYQYRVTGTPYCRFFFDEIKKDIKDFFEKPFNPDDSDDLRKLYKCILNVALNMSYLGEQPVKSADMLMRLIGLQYVNCPSAPLISAYTVDRMYKIWLSGSPKDLFIPPDRASYFETLRERFNADDTALLLNTKTYDDLYMRISYATANLKGDLMEELDNINSSKIVKTVKSIFLDSGYHITDIIDFDDLMKLLSLSSEITEGFPLLKFIGKTGQLIFK